MKRVWILLAAAVFCVFMSGPVLGQGNIHFDMDDPTGDDYGCGTYLYPRNEAFAPFSGLFDLTHFRVWSEPGAKEILFDLTFGAVNNPWIAPEGFIHQLINIYIDARPGGGRVEPFKPGAMVRFPVDQGWEIFIRGAGWSGSGCFYEDPSGGIANAPVHAALEADGHTIRLRVPIEAIGLPQDGWGYYVLIGAYDGFGPDNFRAVSREAGEWVFGGGLEQDVEPNVIDVLAPRSGPNRQEKQLSSYGEREGTCAVVYPVRIGGGGFLPTMGWLAGGLVILAGLGYLANRYGLPKHIPRIFRWKVGGDRTP